MKRAVRWGYAFVAATLCGLVFVLAVQGNPALARDPVAGQARAAACTTCHGPMGLSQLPNAPHLAGQPAIYTAEQLRNYRSGKRPHEVMGVIAKALSDQDIEDLSAWYASLRVSVTAN